jgi:hypothetical protein
LVPVSAKYLRNVSSRVICGSIVTRCVWRLTIIVTVTHSFSISVMDASLITPSSRDVGRADALRRESVANAFIDDAAHWVGAMRL